MSLLIRAAVLLVVLAARSSRGSEYVSVCYYTSWSAKNNLNIRLPVSDIDPSLCTHLVYAFANLDLDSMKLVPDDARTEDSLTGRQGLYAKFNLLKEHNSHLRTLLSIGGQSLVKSNEFAKLSKNPASVTKFATNAASFLRKRGFDGLDIDWEYPNATTKFQYNTLLQKFRDVFRQEAESSGKRELLLTVAVAAGEDTIRKGYDIPTISSIVDYIFIMTYDFFGTWSDVTGFNSPLKPRSDPRFSHLFNVDHAVKTWVEGGADKKKLVVGMTGAGASFTLNDTGNTAVGAPVIKGGGHEGSLFGSKGRLMYPEICLLLNVHWKKEWDAEQSVPFAYSGDQWVGYDDQRSIKEKVKYTIANKLGGVMFWELSFDDPMGKYCNQGKFPLLTVVKKTLGLETGRSVLTKDVDPGIILLTKSSATSPSSFTLHHILTSALVSVCLYRLVVKS